MQQQDKKTRDIATARKLISFVMELYERNQDWWTREQIHRALSTASLVTRTRVSAMRANAKSKD